LGDDGVIAGLEWRSPSLAARVTQLQQWYVLAFIDGATLRVREPLPGQESDHLLWSAGVGMRLAAWDRLEADLDWARPMKEQGPIRAGESRLHFRLRYGF
jgi:hemolysin activation/secretion protein